MDGGARAAPMAAVGIAVGFVTTGVWEGMLERAGGAAGFVAPGRATAAGRPEFTGRLEEAVFAAFLTLGFRGGIGFDKLLGGSPEPT